MEHWVDQIKLFYPPNILSQWLPKKKRKVVKSFIVYKGMHCVKLSSLAIYSMFSTLLRITLINCFSHKCYWCGENTKKAELLQPKRWILIHTIPNCKLLWLHLPCGIEFYWDLKLYSPFTFHYIVHSQSNSNVISASRLNSCENIQWNYMRWKIRRYI